MHAWVLSRWDVTFPSPESGEEGKDVGVSAKDAMPPTGRLAPSRLAAVPSPLDAGNYCSGKGCAGALTLPTFKRTGQGLASFWLFVVYAPQNSPSPSALVDTVALRACPPPNSMSLTLSG